MQSSNESGGLLQSSTERAPLMQVDRYLFDVGLFVTFLIRIAVVWMFCFVASRLLRRPGQRFMLWLVFSVVTAAYWTVVLLEFTLLPAGSSGLHAASLGHIVVSSTWEPAFAALTWLLGSAYLLGLIVFLCSRVYNRLRLRRLLQFGCAPAKEFSAGLEKLCREMGVKRCELLILPGIVSPATVYWLKPRIIFPALAKPQLSDFMHIVRHELTHIVRRDYLIASVIDAICMLLFFHPAVWAARRHMRMERELACDLAVIKASPDNRADYAASLTQFVRLSLTVKHPSSSVSFSAPASLLSRRIRNILLEPVSLPAWNHMCSAGMVFTMIMTALLFAPQASVSLDLARVTQRQFASMAESSLNHRMKRHLRFDYTDSPQAEFPNH